MRNVFVMTKTATRTMKARAMRSAWLVERIVSSAIALRLAGWRSSALAGSCFSIDLGDGGLVGVFVEDDLNRVELVFREKPKLPALQRNEQPGALARHGRRAGGEQADDLDADPAAAGEELDFVADFHAEAFGQELAEERSLSQS